MHTRRHFWLVMALILPFESGCLVIERKNLVMVLPPESKTIQLYYNFEGLSVLNSNNSSLDRAKQSLISLSQDGPHYFSTLQVFGLDIEGQFEIPRFYLDPGRKRQLCMDQRATLANRDLIAISLNKTLLRYGDLTNDLNAEQLFQQIREANKALEDPELVEELRKKTDEVALFNDLIDPGIILVRIARDLDVKSLERLILVLRRGVPDQNPPRAFAWFRFEDDCLRLILPVTQECAGRIVRNPKTREVCRAIEPFVSPVSIETHKDGLAITLGAGGKPIRFSHKDNSAWMPDQEAAIIREAGNPTVLMQGNKVANSERLIEEFLIEVSKMKK